MTRRIIIPFLVLLLCFLLPALAGLDHRALARKEPVRKTKPPIWPLQEKVRPNPPDRESPERDGLAHGLHTPTSYEGDSLTPSDDDRFDEEHHPVHKPRL